MILPAAAFFMAPGHVAPISYLWAGYLAAWGIYVSYLLFLMRKLAKLKKEAAELGSGMTENAPTRSTPVAMSGPIPVPQSTPHVLPPGTRRQPSVCSGFSFQSRSLEQGTS